MTAEDRPLLMSASSNTLADEDTDTARLRAANRRSFLKGVGTAGMTIAASGLVSTDLLAQASSGHIKKGDAAILRFAAAAEIIETDLWQQYTELGGKQIRSYPASREEILFTHWPWVNSMKTWTSTSTTTQKMKKLTSSSSTPTSFLKARTPWTLTGSAP